MDIRTMNQEEVNALRKQAADQAKRERKAAQDITPRTPEGFPIFNSCNHTFVDLSDLATHGEAGMHTISVKLPNGEYITVCSIPYSSTRHQDGCVDIDYHGERQTQVIAFADGRDQRISGSLYSLTYEKK